MGVKIDIGILSRAGLTRPWLEQMYGSLSGTLHSIGLTKLMQFLITSQIPSLRQDITLLLILRAAGDDAWRVYRRKHPQRADHEYPGDHMLTLSD